MRGGREVWVEDKYSGRPIRGNALGEELTISTSGGLSEKAAIERRKEEAKAGVQGGRDVKTRFTRDWSKAHSFKKKV